MTITQYNSPEFVKFHEAINNSIKRLDFELSFYEGSLGNTNSREYDHPNDLGIYLNYPQSVAILHSYRSQYNTQILQTEITENTELRNVYISRLNQLRANYENLKNKHLRILQFEGYTVSESIAASKCIQVIAGELLILQIHLQATPDAIDSPPPQAPRFEANYSANVNGIFLAMRHARANTNPYWNTETNNYSKKDIENYFESIGIKKTTVGNAYKSYTKFHSSFRVQCNKLTSSVTQQVNEIAKHYSIEGL